MNKKIILNFIILSVLILLIVFDFEKDSKPKFNDGIINSEKTLKYYDTKYSIDDMYKLISKGDNPQDEEFYDIILNWFDYYSEENLFINRFGDKYNYEEYQKIRNKYSDELFIILILNVKKDWFKDILNK